MNAAAWYEELRSGPGWSRLLVQRAPQLAAAALLIALAIECAMILTRSLGQSALPPPEPGALHTSPMPPRENPAVELATVVNAHIFGVAGAQPGGSAPTTTMPLVLAGVIANKDPAKGQAIIGDSAASAKLLAVGAMAPGGARLNAVYGDRVIIDRNGHLETLPLPRNPMKGGFQSVPSTGMAAAPPGARESGALLAGLVRVQPVFEQNKLSGYHIFPGGPHGNTAFTQLGLRPGDLITAINGTPLDDAARAMEVLQTLSSSASATVTVQRNGQTQELNLNLATLNTETEASGAENPAGTGPSAGAPGPAGGLPMRGRLPPVPADVPPAANPAANSER